MAAMGTVISELVIILLLLLANGIFAMAEIAMVSSRKGRLKLRADAGERRAKLALELADDPTRFLSTVQIGITLVGIFAGAFGGATIASELTAVLSRAPGLGIYADAIALGIVVLGITYMTLVVGELAPKRLGLSNPERLAVLFAPSMHRLSLLAKPAVSFLGWSTDKLLGIFRIRPPAQATVTEEEVKSLMQEGLRAGAFNQAESQMVESVLALDQLSVREIMTPRAKILWINQNDSHEAIWHKIVVSNHSYFPVYEGHRDNVVGIVSIKAIYANLAAGTGVKTKDLMVRPLVVAWSQKVVHLLETLKRSGKHIALVADEFGSVTGLVTLHDVMEAIVGDFPSQDERLKPTAVKRDEGSWLIDAMIEIDRLEGTVPGLCFGEPGTRDYQTLAGYVLKQLQHVPREGETFEAQGYIFEVLDMDRHRVDKVLLVPIPPARKAESDQFQI